METYFENWGYWRVEIFGLAIGCYKKRPYINFSWSTLKYQTKRKTVWAFHRAKHGWAAPDTWSFDSYLAEVIIGGVKHLKKVKVGIPMDIQYGDPIEFGDDGQPVEKFTFEEAEKEWEKILDQIVEGFEAWLKIVDLDWKTQEDRQQLEAVFDKGFELFHKHFGGLWD